MIVPFTSANAPKPTGPQAPQAQMPPDVYMLMAASQMHQEGKLTAGSSSVPPTPTRPQAK